MTNINAGDAALLNNAPGASSSSGDGVPGPSTEGTMATAGVMSFKNFGFFKGFILANVTKLFMVFKNTRLTLLLLHPMGVWLLM